MRSGDRILLWVGGQSPTYERGIWGDGLVSGKTRYDVAANDDTISPYWRNPEVGKRHQNFTPYPHHAADQQRSHRPDAAGARDQRS